MEKRLKLNLNLPNDAMNVFGRTDRREDLKKILVKTNTFPITVNKLIKAQNIVIPLEYDHIAMLTTFYYSVIS